MNGILNYSCFSFLTRPHPHPLSQYLAIHGSFEGGLSPPWIASLLFQLVMSTVLGDWKVHQILITEDQAETQKAK